MRPKFEHDNSYACLLAEVLEDNREEKRPPSSKRGELASMKAAAAKQQPQSSIRHRKISAAAAAAAAAAASTTSTTSASPEPAPAPLPLPLLVERDDPTLTECLRFNRFVQTGYRRAPLSKKECLCSLSYAHNETFNVVSHLVPLVLVAVALATGALSATWPRSGGSVGDRERDLSLLLHLLPVLLCLSGSVCYHLFMADTGNYSKYLSIDVCGVLALTVDGTRAMASRPAGCFAAVGAQRFSPLALLREALVSPWAAGGSPSLSLPSLSSLVSSAALARDAALASYAALVAFAATKVLRGRTAAERGLPLLLLLLARFAVLAARAAEVKSLSFSFSAAAAAAAADSPSSSPSSSYSFPPGVASLRSSLRWYACAEAFSFAGGLVNVLRVPERWVRHLPPLATTTTATGGKTTTAPRFRLVDFAFNSHNLMHLFSLVALGCYHAAAAEDRRHWLEYGCGS